MQRSSPPPWVDDHAGSPGASSTAITPGADRDLDGSGEFEAFDLSGQPVIAVHNVSFAYPQRPGTQPGADAQVLSDVSLDVHAGEYVAILGRNGSGKSTLAKLMNGLMRPRAGRVLVQGRETTDRQHLRAVRQAVGMVFQNPDNQLVATVVEEEVAFGLENYAVPRDEMLARVTDALERVGMQAHRLRRPHQLSGGQKQRVAIASVIAMRPRCIIFDEATSMLDVQGRRDVQALMRTLHEQGMAVVAITHHMDEALQAQRVVVLDRGRVVLEGTPREVFSQVDSLHRLGLDVPIATDMAARFQRDATDSGLSPLPRDLLTVREFADAWSALHGGSVKGETRTRQPGFPTAQPYTGQAAAKAGDRSPTAASPPDAIAEGHDGTGANVRRDPVIQIRALSHTYLKDTPLAQTALRDVSLDIYRGEIAAIVGQTGSGKSTLVQHFNGLLTPQAGTVVVDGVDLGNRKADVKRVRGNVGLVFQNPEDQLFEALIGDEIAYGPFQFGYALDEVRERVRFAMDWVGLDFAWRDRPVQALSGGEQRKVAIAGVIALRPAVLVLDEPTAGLDPKARADLLTNLQRLRDDFGMTLVIVTHQMEEVARLADRVIVIADGAIAAEVSARALFADSNRLRALHLGEPDTVSLLRAVAQTGTQLDVVQLTRDGVFEQLRTAATAGTGEGTRNGDS